MSRLCLSLQLRPLTANFSNSKFCLFLGFIIPLRIVSSHTMIHIYSCQGRKGSTQPRGSEGSPQNESIPTLKSLSPRPSTSQQISSSSSGFRSDFPNTMDWSFSSSHPSLDFTPLSISTENANSGREYRDEAPTIPYSIPPSSFHGSLQIGRPCHPGVYRTTLYRPYVPNVEDLLSSSYHRNRGQAPTFVHSRYNTVLVNDAMFSHWFRITYPMRNPKEECA